ncbi:MAG: hypothetical protein H7Y61_13715, partial [Rhizobiales bacterium]|nr:hypothetical protein [Rhizobacter sp.]
MTIQSAEERPARTSSGFIYIAVGLVFLLAAIALLVFRPAGMTIVVMVVASLV